MELLTKSAQETQELGKKLATDLLKGNITLNILCLYGDLGSGKTTFARGLAKGLGIKERILSPTFILMRHYSIPGHQEVSNFYHVDLYRIMDERDIEAVGLKEIWSNPKNIIMIEWPGKIEKLLPKDKINIYFEYVSEKERKIHYEIVY